VFKYPVAWYEIGTITSADIFDLGAIKDGSGFILVMKIAVFGRTVDPTREQRIAELTMVFPRAVEIGISAFHAE
jgi:hypothetical protein